MVTSSSRLSRPSISMAGIWRVCNMGWLLTKPAESAVPVIVNRASAMRRPKVLRVHPKRPPLSSRGPALPIVTGRVIQISDIFLG